MSYGAILDDIERRFAKLLGESSAKSPYLPDGYCPLATAVDRAAAAYFPQEYGETEISPQQRDRLARHHRAIEDIKRLDAWEREAERRCKHAENARSASAGNIRSAVRRTDTLPAEKTSSARPLSENQEKEARRDAIEDDEARSTRQLMERRETLIDNAWRRLRQHLGEGRLVGSVLRSHDGHLQEMEAPMWRSRRAENAHKQDEFMNVLVREAALAALLGEDQPQGNVNAEHGTSDQDNHANAPKQTKSRPLQRRRAGAVSLEDHDAPLVAEMRRLITAGEAPSILAAAGMVLAAAKGQGTDESKLRRLRKRYSKQYPAELD